MVRSVSTHVSRLPPPPLAAGYVDPVLSAGELFCYRLSYSNAAALKKKTQIAVDHEPSCLSQTFLSSFGGVDSALGLLKRVSTTKGRRERGNVDVAAAAALEALVEMLSAHSKVTSKVARVAQAKGATNGVQNWAQHSIGKYTFKREALLRSESPGKGFGQYNPDAVLVKDDAASGLSEVRA